MTRPKPAGRPHGLGRLAGPAFVAIGAQLAAALIVLALLATLDGAMP
jgi:hypothetical protein